MRTPRFIPKRFFFAIIVLSSAVQAAKASTLECLSLVDDLTTKGILVELATDFVDVQCTEPTIHKTLAFHLLLTEPQNICMQLQHLGLPETTEFSSVVKVQVGKVQLDGTWGGVLGDPSVTASFRANRPREILGSYWGALAIDEDGVTALIEQLGFTNYDSQNRRIVNLQWWPEFSDIRFPDRGDLVVPSRLGIAEKSGTQYEILVTHYETTLEN